MDAEIDIPWASFAKFMQQYTHDIRNGLNGLELESALLQEIITDETALASVGRARKQVRALGQKMRSLSNLFQDPSPNLCPLPARDLLDLWRDKHEAMASAPKVQWLNELAEERVNVDPDMMAAVFAELSSNAFAFSHGEPLIIVGRAEAGIVILALHEPKKEAVDPSQWSQPLVTTKRGGYGLGLWSARRLLDANGWSFVQRYDADRKTLSTEMTLAAA